jgi:fructose-1,6-bisphosphatase/inositol monophosphatase family enzyme
MSKIDIMPSMKIIEPSANHPYLTLPTEGTETIQIPASDTLIEAWTAPIQDTSSAEELLSRVIEIGNAFNTLITFGQDKVKNELKSGPFDVVTEMDKGIEALFRSWLKHHYPHHKVVGEEWPNDAFGEDDVVWYLDPIDGTSNFVDNKPDVAVHLGCLYQGKPFVSYVGQPFIEADYAAHIESNESLDLTLPEKPVIGTEYFPNRIHEDNNYKDILAQLNAEPHARKSIGRHIVDLLEGNVTAFYKPRVKPWDIIAPLEVLVLLQKDHWHCDLYIPDFENPDDFLRVDPFTNEPRVLEYFNKKLSQNSRYGHILVTPTSEPELRDFLEEHILLNNVI